MSERPAGRKLMPRVCRGLAKRAALAGIVLAAALGLGSCGGGGGGGETNEAPPPPPPAATAPAITTQPTNVSVTAGQPASFTVVASGTAPLQYQWQRNGAEVAGATSPTYTIAATALGDNTATFAVRVSNSAGSVTSSAATLTVSAAATAPLITTSPADASVTVGQPVTFTVTATGSAPLAYQWQRDGTPIGGATDAAYTIASTALTDNGARFAVRVSNSAGTVTSAAATLTVNAGTGVSGTLTVTGDAAGTSGGTFSPTLSGRVAETGPTCAGAALCQSRFELIGGELGVQGVFSSEALSVTIVSLAPPPGAAPGTQPTAVAVSYLVSTGASSTLYVLECTVSSATCTDPAASGVVVDRQQRTVTFTNARLLRDPERTVSTTLNGVLRY